MLDSDPCQRDRPCPTTLFHYLALYCFCCCCCSVTKSCPILCDYLFCSMEKAMTPHSSTLAWKIPWAEEPGRLQSMGSLRVRLDWATSLSLFTFIIGEGNGNPLQCSCLENPRDGGAWWASVNGVAQSQTRLKRLSSSSSRASTLISNFLSIASCVANVKETFLDIE